MSDTQNFNDLEEQIRETMRVSGPDPAFVARLRSDLSHRPQPCQRFFLRPAWALAILLALAVAALSVPGVARAVRQVFGFVPGMGLVDQDTVQRKLEAPVSVTRAGIVLTIEQVVVYADRIELAYRVDGLSQAASDQPVCSGADMYPVLRLPDGTQIAADSMALGGKWLADGYTAGHAFTAAIPAGLEDATFLLPCLQTAPRGSAPEDWVVPFRLITTPPGETVGQLLQPGSALLTVRPAAVDASFSFLGGALEETGYHFFFRFVVPSGDPDFLAARPAAVYLIDSSGKHIDVINALPWSPFDQVDIWEYRAALPPAPGPVTLVVDGVEIFYQAQAAAFSFTPGAQPSVGQTWNLNQQFKIGGHSLTVTSAEMVEEQGHRGFVFTIQAGQPETRLSAEVMDMTPSDAALSMWSTVGDRTPAQTVQTGFVYESAVPETLTVTFNTLSVVVDGRWQMGWTPAQP